MIRLCKLSKAVISRIEKKVDGINGVKINVSQAVTRKGSSAYFESTLAEREECHAVLRQFEEQGAIECEWLKQGNDSFKLLSRINVKNTQSLFELTGRVPVSIIISKFI